MIGDNCVIDHDCKNIAGGGGAICKANKCVCKDEKMVGDVMGSRCGERKFIEREMENVYNEKY